MYNCECGADLIQEDCETIIGVCQESPVVKDYEALVNKPQINGVTLQGNKTSEDLGISQEIADAVSAEATLRENADTALGGRIDDEITAREGADTALGGRIDNANTRIDNEILARQGADNNLQTQIDAITSKSDVVDVVASYQALLAYDTSKLNDNDVIKVLDDETHDDALTYYRWSTTAQTWSYIGQEAPYYSKGQMDAKLAEKQDKLIAGANIQIAQDGKTISATDTTYTSGNGLNLNGTEFSVDETVVATKSDLTNYYTKTETDTKLAPKLETEVVSTLPTTGDEGKLYLTPKDYTTGTATGNPITISLGEDAGQITSARIDGDTYQQTYTGKNLFDIGQYSNALLRGGGTGVSLEKINSRTLRATNKIKQSNNFCGIPVPNYTELLGETVTVSGSIARHDVPNTKIIFAWNTYSVSAFGQSLALGQDGSFSLTQSIPESAPSGAIGLLVVIYANGEGTLGEVDGYVDWSDIQLEVGSSATSFEPYVGGQPSPNPDYPQQIQTVTGEQTVSINGTDYPISLGSIELCKLGTYQDYIWKDGDDWKVHRETKRVTVDGSQRNGNLTQYGFAQIRIDSEALFVSAPPVSYCSNLSSHDIYSSLPKTYAIRSSSTQCNFRLYFTPELKDFDAYLDWCAENKPSVVAPLQQSAHTDTTITDQTLIAQLEAVRTASLQASNTITNTATGTNLAGDLELAYCEFDPHSRYDKWLWLDINNDYEQIGS